MRTLYADDGTRVIELTTGRRIIAALGVGVWRVALCSRDGDGQVVELSVHAGPDLEDAITRCIADDWGLP